MATWKSTKTSYQGNFTGLVEDASTVAVALRYAQQEVLELRNLLEHAFMGISRLDTQGRHISVNQAYANMLGYRADEMDGMPWQKTIHPDDLGVGLAIYQNTLQTGRGQYEARALRKDGSVFHTHTVLAKAYDKDLRFIGYHCFISDITAGKEAEEQLIATQARLHHLVATSPAVIYSCKPLIPYTFTFVSKNLATEFGHQPQEFLADNRFWADHVHPSDVPSVLAGLSLVLAQGSHSQEYRFLHKDGAYRWVHNELRLIRDAEGEPLEIVGFWVDVTEQKQAEASLRESEELNRLLLECNSEAIYGVDLEGKCIFANPACLRLLGYERLDQLLGQDMHQLIHYACKNDAGLPNQECGIYQPYRQVSGTHVDDEALWRADGTSFAVEYLADPILRDGQVVGAVVTFADITERKREEERRLAQAEQQRDALVREVHHRIKNNLQGVIGLLREHATQHPEIKQILEGAISQVRTISVVHGLQSLARASLSVGDLVQAICSAVEDLLQGGIELVFGNGLADDPCLVENEAVPVALIVNELLTNAIKHGVVSDSGDAAVRVSLQGAAGEVAIVVRNYGMSFPPEFDFAADKGLGTGLGLVKSLLPPQGARLFFETASGGTKVELILRAPVIYFPGKRS